MMVVYEDLRGCESTKGHFLFDGRWAGEWDDWSVNGMLINLCILSGTDYLPNRKGIGITGAHEALRAHKGDVRRALSSPPTAKQPSLKNKAKFGSGAELEAYLLQMDRVRAVFTHALVYDSMRHRVVPLNDLPPEGEGEEGDEGVPPSGSRRRIPPHLGIPLDPTIAKRVCEDGELDPTTLKVRESSPKQTANSRAVNDAYMECARIVQEANERAKEEFAASHPPTAEQAGSASRHAGGGGDGDGRMTRMILLLWSSWQSRITKVLTVLTASRSRRLLFFATAAAVPADDAAGSGGWRRWRGSGAAIRQPCSA